MASRVLRDQLIGLVESYLRNVKLFAAFEKGFLDLTWDAHLLRDEELDTLVADLEHAMIEYQAGLLDEEALRVRLADIIHSVPAKATLA